LLVEPEQTHYKRVLPQDPITNESSKKLTIQKEFIQVEVQSHEVEETIAINNAVQLTTDSGDAFFVSSSYKTFALCSNLKNDVFLNVNTFN
jgi:hypothetical protein